MGHKLGLLGVAGAVVAATLLASPASADDSTGGSSKVTRIAEGLDNPRGLAVRGDTLYIAEAGSGGDGPCAGSPEGGIACLGTTGKISAMKLRPGKGTYDVLTGLPSFAGQGTGGEAIGPNDVSIDGIGQVWFTIGLGGTREDLLAQLDGPGGEDLVALMGTSGKVRSGAYIQRGDPSAFEVTDNPDGRQVDTNPNAIVITGGGSHFVVDAGGNSVVSVKSDGTVKTVLTFDLKPTADNPFPGDPATIDPDPVPDSITRGPDGTFYIGELTGFPFVPGTAAVWKYRPGQQKTVFADGFTNIIDVAVLPSGELLVLEIAADGLLSAPPGTLPAGALIKVSADGQTKTPVDAGELLAPGGMTVDPSGQYVYISNKSVLAGAGEIVRVEL